MLTTANRKLTLIAVIALPLAATALARWGTAQQREAEMLNAVPDANAAVLMRAKLGSSHKIVEGLMAGDCTMISKGASDLQKICDSSNWRRHEDQVVTHYRNELRRGATKLVKHAESENLEGAAYTYMHTLTTCINCHEYARNVLRIADSDTPSPVVRIPVTEREAHAYEHAHITR
jgi:hypothetical protein